MSATHDALGRTETLELLVVARQPYGEVPWLFAESLPDDASLDDNGDGTRTLS